MHPDLYPLASELVRDRRSRAARRRELLPRPRPPGGRLRHRTARFLVATAAHLADEPVLVLPARRRRLRLVRRA